MVRNKDDVKYQFLRVFNSRPTIRGAKKCSIWRKFHRILQLYWTQVSSQHMQTALKFFTTRLPVHMRSVLCALKPPTMEEALYELSSAGFLNQEKIKSDKPDNNALRYETGSLRYTIHNWSHHFKTTRSIWISDNHNNKRSDHNNFHQHLSKTKRIQTNIQTPLILQTTIPELPRTTRIQTNIQTPPFQHYPRPEPVGVDKSKQSGRV